MDARNRTIATAISVLHCVPMPEDDSMLPVGRSRVGIPFSGAPKEIVELAQDCRSSSWGSKSYGLPSGGPDLPGIGATGGSAWKPGAAVRRNDIKSRRLPPWVGTALTHPLRRLSVCLLYLRPVPAIADLH